MVRLLEETPRERALEVGIAQLKKGLSYKDLLAGLFLAGIRNIKPRPVGFKFHAVMVINSAHVLGQSSAVTERLLPLFWALDNFKASQAQDVKEGDWVLEAVDECRLPKVAAAQEEFVTRHGSLGRRGRRRGRRGALPQLGGGRRRWSRSGGGGARPAQYRSQGDLRRPELAHPANHRLGARRAGAALARLRHARPPGRLAPAPGRAVRGQPGKRRQDSPGLGHRPR